MKLYLCRHAVAKEFVRGGDSQRPLTTAGKKKFARAAAGLATLNPPIAIIFTSPYVRTLQTAEILVKTLGRPAGAVKGARVPVIAIAELAPGGTPKLLLEQLKSQKRRPPAILAVGHEPDLSRFLGQLCFGEAGRVRFKKGAIACVNLDLNLAQGELLFLMQPKQLMALAHSEAI